MKKILVPIDFSSTSKNAANYAAVVAKQLKAEIILMHAYIEPLATGDLPVVSISFEELKKAVDEQLVKIENELITKHGKDIVISSITKIGFVFEEIKDTVEKNNIDLIVMGITGAGKFSELLIGSNATRVVHLLKCPVFIVPPEGRFTQIKNIAFACDYNQLEESKAVDKLVEFVKLFNAKLMIVNISNDLKKPAQPKELAGVLLEYIFENVDESLDIPDNVDYSVYKIKDEDIVHGINNFVDKHKADLLVMIPRKHNLLSTLFNESNTKKMAFHTHVPLLALHEEQ